MGIPSDATVALLLNAPGVIQGRNGTLMGGFSDMLDKEKRSLHWNSQRGDKNSNVILAIVAHQRAGGRVVVGVRAGVSGKDFKKLGEVSRITDVQESKLLLNNGDVVIIESGGARVHRQIMPSCLD